MKKIIKKEFSTEFRVEKSITTTYNLEGISSEILLTTQITKSNNPSFLLSYEPDNIHNSLFFRVIEDTPINYAIFLEDTPIVEIYTIKNIGYITREKIKGEPRDFLKVDYEVTSYDMKE